MNILDLPRREFLGAIEELSAQGVDVSGLRQQYREQSSPFSKLFDYTRENAAALAAEGRRPVLGGLLSKEPVWGVDTIRYEGIGPIIAGLLDPVARGFDAPAAAMRGDLTREEMIGEAMGTAGVAMGLGGAAARPAGSVGMGGRVGSLGEINVTAKDASNIFGEGSQRVRYTDPKTDGTIEVVVRPDGSASVLELEVPKGSRGKGIGQSLQERVMQDFPVMGGQVSSKAAATTAYRLGRRPPGKPNATLDDVFADIDEMSSVNMVSPAMQERFTPSLPAPRNEAEATAKQVLEMLTAGRADDITDDMLAAADDPYLFKNYDLPMDEASRTARAAETGFDVGKVRYHGSELDLSDLDPDMGSGERYRTGVFSTDNPDVADSYVSTSGGTIYPIITRRNDSGSVIDAAGANWNRIPSSAVAETKGINTTATAYDVAPELYDDLSGRAASTNALARQKRFEGDANITFENLVDRGAAIKKYLGETPEMQKARQLSASQPSEVRVDFYGNQIRSPFARFDPRLSHLSNLSAANASPTAGLLSQAGMSEDQAARTERMLNRMGLLD